MREPEDSNEDSNDYPAVLLFVPYAGSLDLLSAVPPPPATLEH